MLVDQVLGNVRKGQDAVYVNIEVNDIAPKRWKVCGTIDKLPVCRKFVYTILVDYPFV